MKHSQLCVHYVAADLKETNAEVKKILIGYLGAISLLVGHKCLCEGVVLNIIMLKCCTLREYNFI